MNSREILIQKVREEYHGNPHIQSAIRVHIADSFIRLMNMINAIPPEGRVAVFESLLEQLQEHLEEEDSGTHLTKQKTLIIADSLLRAVKEL